MRRKVSRSLHIRWSDILVECYKSARYIKGKLRVVISDENDNIIYENDKRRKSKRCLERRTCCECVTDHTHKDSNGVEIDDIKRWTDVYRVE